MDNNSVDRFVVTCLLVLRFRDDRPTIVLPLALYTPNVLDLARECFEQGARLVGVKVIFTDWLAPQPTTHEYSWRFEQRRRDSLEQWRVRVMLDDKKKRDDERDARALAAPCADCSHPLSVHDYARAPSQSKPCLRCPCGNFSSGLVRVVR